MNNFDISFEDTKMIREYEGESLTAYQCPDGKWTISYGLTGNNIKKGMIISKEKSKEMFLDRIKLFCEQIKNLLKIDLNKNQFLALLSFTWNVGTNALKKSTLLKLVNSGKFEEASLEFGKWDNVNGKEIAGLVRRRKAEKVLFLS